MDHFKICFWCQVNPIEAAKHHEGPHLTWCPYFREEQRGGGKSNKMTKNPNAVSLGRKGGRAKSEAKAAAARENGKKGGRCASEF